MEVFFPIPWLLTTHQPISLHRRHDLTELGAPNICWKTLEVPFSDLNGISHHLAAFVAKEEPRKEEIPIRLLEK